MKSNRDNEKNGVRRKRSPFSSTILATISITAVFAVLIYCMYLFNIVSIFDIPAFLSRGNEDRPTLENSDAFYDGLLTQDSITSLKEIYKVTPQELTAMIADFEPLDNFTIDAQIVSYSSAVTSITDIRAEKNGDSFNVKKYTGGVLSESIVSDGTDVTYTDEIRRRTRKHMLGDGFDFCSVCRIPSLSELIKVCNEADSEDSSVIDYDISLVSSDNKSYYKVVFTYPDVMQREEYYVSPETHMIINAYSYLGDSLYYRYSVNSYKLSEPV